MVEMRAWYNLDEAGRVLVTTTDQEFALGMTEYEFPDDFDFEKQDDYLIVDGELVYDPLPREQEDSMSEKVAAAQATADEAKKVAEQAAAGTNPQLATFAAMQVATMDLTGETDDAVASINTLLLPFDEKEHAYKTGDSFSHDGRTWRVAQAHTSQPQWLPGQGTDSLYYEVVIAPDGILVWRQPTGAHDAPNFGFKRHYPDAGGPVYVSQRNGNTSEPGTDQWWTLDGESGDEGGGDGEEGSQPAEYDPSHQYVKGERCTFDGRVYEWDLDVSGVWSPGDFPGGWKLVE